MNAPCTVLHGSIRMLRWSADGGHQGKGAGQGNDFKSSVNNMIRKNSVAHIFSLGALALLMAPHICSASSATGKVVMIDNAKQYGNIVFVKLDGATTSPAACQTNFAWSFTLPMTSEMDKRMYATLLMAAASGSTVVISGTGSCSEFSAVESAGHLRLMTP